MELCARSPLCFIGAMHHAPRPLLAPNTVEVARALESPGSKEPGEVVQASQEPEAPKTFDLKAIDDYVTRYASDKGFVGISLAMNTVVPRTQSAVVLLTNSDHIDLAPLQNKPRPPQSRRRFTGRPMERFSSFSCPGRERRRARLSRSGRAVIW